MNNKIMAIIPARGGSKGVKRKNVKDLCGKPLIAWTIEAVKNSKYIDRVIVSTEDEEIAAVAKEWGAEVPFLRPAELAKDDTPSIDAVIHCISKIQEDEGYIPDKIMLLQCTSPARGTEDIDNCIEAMAKVQDCDSMVSVAEVEHTPYWNMIIDNDGYLGKFIKYDEKIKTRRQDFEKVYRLNGAMYLTDIDVVMNKRAFLTEKTKPYIMSNLNSVDIDTELDFKIAEVIIKSKAI